MNTFVNQVFGVLATGFEGCDLEHTSGNVRWAALQVLEPRGTADRPPDLAKLDPNMRGAAARKGGARGGDEELEQRSRKSARGGKSAAGQHGNGGDTPRANSAAKGKKRSPEIQKGRAKRKQRKGKEVTEEEEEGEEVEEEEEEEAQKRHQ